MGIIKPGSILFDQKRKFNAKIMADGSLKHKGNEGSIHRVAAKIMGTESYNGWTYWYCNIKGNSVSIDNLRQRLISKKYLITYKLFQYNYLKRFYFLKLFLKIHF